MGYDPIDKGSMSPVAETPKDLKAGRYAYFCRIHPWMRGAFEVVPKNSPPPTGLSVLGR
jgi:hypothetical protein